MTFCAALPATSHVVQWGGSHVWKVGGKLFAIGGWDGRRACIHVQGHPSFVRDLAGASGPASYRMMCDHAEANGANAIVAMRYDANEILSGVTEVICYGAAVVAEPER